MPVLKNMIWCYKDLLKEKEREQFEKEVESWIAEGILLQWKGDIKESVLLLMVVVQN